MQFQAKDHGQKALHASKIFFKQTNNKKKKKKPAFSTIFFKTQGDSFFPFFPDSSRKYIHLHVFWVKERSEVKISIQIFKAECIARAKPK